MIDATKGELLEILGQFGVLGFSEADSIEALHQACLDAGLDDATIVAEVEEQRGR